jgi:hypothetical protein
MVFALRLCEDRRAVHVRVHLSAVEAGGRDARIEF